MRIFIFFFWNIFCVSASQALQILLSSIPTPTNIPLSPFPIPHLRKLHLQTPPFPKSLPSKTPPIPQLQDMVQDRESTLQQVRLLHGQNLATMRRRHDKVVGSLQTTINQLEASLQQFVPWSVPVIPC